MTSYVLVHGGGHGGWCWSRVAPLLRAAGHEVYTPTLTGLGERSHLVTAGTNLDTHIADVVGVLKFEDLTNAVLVGHSYGGMVITGAADRALSRVGHLVFLDASHPRDGESLASESPALMEFARKSSRVVNGVELALWPSQEVIDIMGLVTPQDVAWAAQRLTPHPWKCFEQPLTLADEAAVRKIPRTIVNCTPTLGVEMQVHRERLFQADRVWEIDTGHDLMITEPDAVAEMLERLASVRIAAEPFLGAIDEASAASSRSEARR
jgi:pimeloyl-ACP methyl ester carboxylesterase